MHKYLKSVGFSSLNRKNDLEKILSEVISQYDR